LGRPADAMGVMKKVGQGVSEADFAQLIK